MKKGSKRIDKYRDLKHQEEVMRATIAGKVTPTHKPLMIVSLSGSGVVHQTMTFRPENSPPLGTAWHFKGSGQKPIEFRKHYEALGFTVVEHKKPVRIDYTKTSLVTRVKKEKAVVPPSREELTQLAEVLKLRLGGMIYTKIEEHFGVEGKKGFWAMKMVRKAEAQ